MLDSQLTGQARTALSRYSSDQAVGTMLPLWLQFESFLHTQHGTLPSSIPDIPEQSLRAYATFLDYQDSHVDDALIALSAVLLVCLHAGYNARALRTIVIPRIRRPVRNRHWDAFRLRTYQPLPYAERVHGHSRKAQQEGGAGETTGIDSSVM